MAGNENTTEFAPGPPRHLVAAFLAAPGKMALFEIKKNGQRKAVGVKIFPRRTLPMLTAHALTADTTVAELCDAHPPLKQATALGHYHWDTPRYREICAALGLNADERRPCFRSPYGALAEELLSAAAQFGEGPQGWSSRGGNMEVVFDLLDLMREDLRPRPLRLKRLRESWCQVDSARLPQHEELTRLVQSDELLHTCPEQHLAQQ